MTGRRNLSRNPTERIPGFYIKGCESNDGISENTNRAIEMASGDYIMFSDHDDTLAPNALYEIVKEINENPGTDIVYNR